MSANHTLVTLVKKDKVWIIIISIILITLGCTNILVNPAINFLSDVNSDMMLSLGLAMELKSIVSGTDISKIPLIGGVTSELQDIFTRTINYLTFANIVIGVQTILVNMSKSLLIKIIPVFFLAGLFLKKYKQIALKLLIIILLINPGLSLYVNGIKYISQSMELNLGSNIHQHLSLIKNKYKEKREKIKSKQEIRKEEQLKKAKEKGHKGIGIFTKAEDAVKNTVEDIGVDIGQGVSETFDVLKNGKKELMKLILNMISNLVVLFLILPLFYFYILSFLLKKFFHFSGFSTIATSEFDNLKSLAGDLKNHTT
ncbi:hypothetical protein [Aquimarina sp. AU474]|uniref:hypothetical protein n=1 Tax=Aquimarina sp. AU474 TaxID=2108529 RepID=UPI00135CD96C|nr:hypothetical protein [Aquimarina sp. AU474]